jgi:hypothetical protein
MSPVGRRVRLATLSSFTLLLAALAAAQPRPARVERPVPFRAGERLEYDVSWSSYLTAGTVVLHVADKRPSFNSDAYYIEAEAKPSSLLSRIYTLYYKADTLLDVYSLLPQRGSVYSREGKRQRMKVTSFNHGAKKARFDMQTATSMTKEMAVTPATQDVLSAIYALRTAAPKPGDRIHLTVADSGRLYQADFAVGKPESIRLPSGAIPALRIAPTIVNDAGETIAAGSVLWLSNDAERLPLRLEMPLSAGRFVLSLRQRPGTR